MKNPLTSIKLSEPLQPHIFLIMLLAGVISAIGVTMFLAPVHLYDSAISGTSMLLWQITPPQFTFYLEEYHEEVSLSVSGCPECTAVPVRTAQTGRGIYHLFRLGGYCLFCGIPYF